MKISIHQPAYLPWTGYFNKIKNVDLFIFLDTVQFQKGSFQNRNKIYSKNGPIWLTVPVKTSGNHLADRCIKDLLIDNEQSWQDKHLKAIQNVYSKAPMYKELFPHIEKFYINEVKGLSDLCWEMLKTFNQILGIKTPVIKASEIPGLNGKKSDLIQNICHLTKADKYLSGDLGSQYLVEDDFKNSGILIEYQNYKVKEYKQLAEGFFPALGIIDLLFNCDSPHLYI